MKKLLRKLLYPLFRKMIQVYGVQTVADADMLTINPKYLEEKIKRDLMYKLFDKAVSDGFIEITSWDDPATGGRIYRGKLKVIK